MKCLRSQGQVLEPDSDQASQHFIEGEVDTTGARMCVRYRFRTQGVQRNIDVEHLRQSFFVHLEGRVWEIQHSKDWNTKTMLKRRLPIPMAGGDPLEADLQLDWNTTQKWKWRYALSVNMVTVPPYWVKHRDVVPASRIPEVVDVENDVGGPPDPAKRGYNIVCMFRFTTRGQMRTVSIAADKTKFAALLDNVVTIKQLSRSTDGRGFEDDLLVPLRGAAGLSAKIVMEKKPKPWMSHYWAGSLQVNRKPVPVAWTRKPKSEVPPPEPPEMVDSDRECPPTVEEFGGVPNEKPDVSRAAYHDGQMVEYFSWESFQWLPGIVSVKSLGWSGRQPKFAYDVSLTPGQVQEDVELHSLRRPLGEGELVEVFSHLQGWIAGRISNNQPQDATLVGYTVQTQAEPEPAELSNVSPSRLRRRFEAGADIEVYDGPLVGWVPAWIGPEAGAGTNTVEASQPVGAGQPSQREDPVGVMMGTMAQPRLQPWTVLPIVREGIGSARDSKPLFAIRQQQFLLTIADV